MVYKLLLVCDELSKETEKRIWGPIKKLVMPETAKLVSTDFTRVSAMTDWKLKTSTTKKPLVFHYRQFKKHC